jgi:hypothetical protein
VIFSVAISDWMFKKASQFKFINDCPVSYIHREYIGTGVLRGRPVPGVKKVALRLRVPDLRLTPAGEKYLYALAGLRARKSTGELRLACDLYPIVEGVQVRISDYCCSHLSDTPALDNVRFLYDQACRLVDEASKADVIDAAVAAGRDPATDATVLAMDKDIAARVAARAADTARERERRAAEEKQRMLAAREERAAARRARLAAEAEAEAQAKLAGEAVAAAPTA